MAPPPAKLSRLRSRGLVSVRGPDWRGFLQGLITQDVETLAPGALRYGALLTPQGRLLYDLLLHGDLDGGGVTLETAASARHALVQRLSLYRLRAKVEVADAEGAVFVLWDSAAAGPGWTLDPRLPALGWRAIGLAAPEAQGAETVDEALYEAHRLALGAPDAIHDGLHDKVYPIEANLDLLNGIDFRKGCFVGQETTSRMKRRGQVRTRMLPLHVEGTPPARGAEVLAGSLRAGEVAGVGEATALALIRLDRLGAGPLTVDGRPADAQPPAWLPLPDPAAGEPSE